METVFYKALRDGVIFHHHDNLRKMDDGKIYQ